MQPSFSEKNSFAFTTEQHVRNVLPKFRIDSMTIEFERDIEVVRKSDYGRDTEICKRMRLARYKRYPSQKSK